MKYEVDLPDDVDRRLSQKASETGDDVVHLIRIAIGRFVSEEMPSTNGAWSEEGERRRRMLIDQDIAGTASTDELAELARLNQLANDHFDQVAPPPAEGARLLHNRLLRNRGNRGN